MLKPKVICAGCCLSPTRTVTPTAASTVTLLPFTPLWSSLSKTFNHNSTNTACLWQEGFSLLKEFFEWTWGNSNTAVDAFPPIIRFSQPHVHGDKERSPIRRENLIMSLVWLNSACKHTEWLSCDEARLFRRQSKQEGCGWGILITPIHIDQSSPVAHAMTFTLRRPHHSCWHFREEFWICVISPKPYLSASYWLLIAASACLHSQPLSHCA